MKKWIAALLAAVLMAVLVSCRVAEENPTLPEPPSTAQTQQTTVPTETAVQTVVTQPLATQTQPTETEPAPTETQPVETQPTQPPTEPATKPTEPEPTQTKPTEPAPTEPEEDASLLVKVTDYLSGVKVMLRYATEDNFTGEKIYDFEDAYLRCGTVEKLKKVCRELAQQGIGIVIWDGFRPVNAQAKLWECCPDANFVSHPITGTRSHCRGSAVDVTLYDLATGELLEMPSDFDEFSALGDRDYSDCSEEAAKNARLLESVMKKYGFSAYQKEWWHFSDTESYPVETFFDPAFGDQWYATCNKSMSLRKTASVTASSIGTVRANDTMTLLGWASDFAKVSYNGKIGYVLQSYIKPVEQDAYDTLLETVGFDLNYTYEEMLADLQEFLTRYPDRVEVEVIGVSELGKDIPVLRIGSEDAKYHVLIQAAIHGCEYQTSWIAMAMADYWLDHGLLGYGDICWHIIPMTNPDGVQIAQTGTLNDAQREIYLRDLALGYTDLTEEEYARSWKANGVGVDLNRNFPSGWDIITYRDAPSAKLYAGEEPFSASEAAALRDYTLRYSFDATVSYHTAGNIIYFDYGEYSQTNVRSEKFARAVADVNGFPLIDSTVVDGAGYKDWCIDALSIPSLTVELGIFQSGDFNREAYSIFARNYMTWAAAAIWLQS